MNTRALSGLTSLLAILLVTAVPAANASDDALPWDEEARLLMHASYLANDAREGRGIGTAGLDSSAQYIARRFEEYGLRPLFGESFRQPFEMGWGVEPDSDRCYLTQGDNRLTYGKHLMPLGFTGNGQINAPVVFVGYGITADEYDYDDYAGVDVKDAIVLAFDGEPAADDPDSRFEGTVHTPHSEWRNKAINAKTHGAAGFLLVRGMEAEGDTLFTLKTEAPYRDVGIPCAMITREGASVLVPDLKLTAAQRSIDLNETPRSMPASKEPLTLSIAVERETIAVTNIGGKLPGDPDRIIVVGAHYDHLGFGQEGTTEPGVYGVHNGADDNASGVAILLEMARILADKGSSSRPTLWFVSFTGEEVGLVGSSHFVNQPPETLDKVQFMLNIDNVGRMQATNLSVLGVGSAKELKRMAEEVGQAAGLTISAAGGGYGPSDQTSFYARGIPVSHLLTTPHLDYHSTRDDVDMLNGEGMVRVLDFALCFLDELAEPGLMLTYVEQTPPTPSKSRGNRPSLGTIPDFAQPDSIRGVRIQGVRDGAPAALAGLQQGDILVRMGEVIIDNIYDFVFALDNHNPHDKVKIEFLRNGERLTTEAILASPAKRSGGHPGGGHPDSKKQGHPGGHPGGGQ